MKISGDQGKTYPVLNLMEQYGWLWRRKFTLALLFVGVTAFVAGVLLQREDVIGASKRFVLSFFDETHAVSNYIEGLRAEPERLTIDIKHKHFTKLVEWRRLALERNQITPDLKVFVPAEIRHGDRTLKVKLRFKGQWTDHLYTDKWSFRIKVGGEDNLFGMRRFSLQHPLTRSYGGEPAYLNALARHDIATVRYRFVAVTVNGRDLGIYALEEAIAKEMIEHRKRREGVVVRYSTELHYSPFEDIAGRNNLVVDSGIGDFSAAQVTPYGDKHIENSEALRKQFHTARSLLERFRDGELPVKAVFDIPRLAYFFAVSELMGTEVMVRDWKDRRFLYNPLTMLLEPVGIEGAHFIPLTSISGAVNDRPRDEFHSLLYADQEFLEYYTSALEDVSSTSYVENLFERIDGDLRKDFQIVYSEWPRWSFSKETIAQNAEFIRAHLNPKQGLHAYFFNRDEARVELEVGVIQPMSLEVIDVEISGSVIYPEKRLVLAGKAPGDTVAFQTVSFPLSSSQKVLPGGAERPILRYRILGSDEIYTQEIHASRKLDASIIPSNLLKKPANHQDFPFIAIDPASKKITFKPGNWLLAKDLILPTGHQIKASVGVKLTLTNGASILSRSPLSFVGSPEQPIVIESQLHKGGGLLVQEAGGSSVLEYVEFHGLSAPLQPGLALTGAVTFYESPVDIRHCVFNANRSEDGLNIIRSEFLIEKSLFSGSPSDALDSDFSHGRVLTSRFTDIGADGLDFSGSEVIVEDLLLESIGDKALSIGEASSISGNSLSIQTALIGMAVKDMSEANFSDLEMKDTKIGIAVFQKKPEFGPAKSVLTQLRLINSQTRYIVESGSTLMVDDQRIGTSDKAAMEMIAAMY